MSLWILRVLQMWCDTNWLRGEYGRGHSASSTTPSFCCAIRTAEDVKLRELHFPDTLAARALDPVQVPLVDARINNQAFDSPLRFMNNFLEVISLGNRALPFTRSTFLHFHLVSEL